MPVRRAIAPRCAGPPDEQDKGFTGNAAEKCRAGVGPEETVSVGPVLYPALARDGDAGAAAELGMGSGDRAAAAERGAVAPDGAASLASEAGFLANAPAELVVGAQAGARMHSLAGGATKPLPLQNAAQGRLAPGGAAQARSPAQLPPLTSLVAARAACAAAVVDLRAAAQCVGAGCRSQLEDAVASARVESAVANAPQAFRVGPGGLPGAVEPRAWPSAFVQFSGGDCAPNLSQPRRGRIQRVLRYLIEREELECALPSDAVDPLTPGGCYKAPSHFRWSTPDMPAVVASAWRRQQTPCAAPGVWMGDDGRVWPRLPTAGPEPSGRIKAELQASIERQHPPPNPCEHLPLTGAVQCETPTCRLPSSFGRIRARGECGHCSVEGSAATGREFAGGQCCVGGELFGARKPFRSAAAAEDSFADSAALAASFARDSAAWGPAQGAALVGVARRRVRRFDISANRAAWFSPCELAISIETGAGAVTAHANRRMFPGRGVAVMRARKRILDRGAAADGLRFLGARPTGPWDAGALRVLVAPRPAAERACQTRRCATALPTASAESRRAKTMARARAAGGAAKSKEMQKGREPSLCCRRTRKRKRTDMRFFPAWRARRSEIEGLAGRAARNYVAAMRVSVPRDANVCSGVWILRCWVPNATKHGFEVRLRQVLLAQLAQRNPLGLAASFQRIAVRSVEFLDILLPWHLGSPLCTARSPELVEGDMAEVLSVVTLRTGEDTHPSRVIRELAPGTLLTLLAVGLGRRVKVQVYGEESAVGWASQGAGTVLRRPVRTATKQGHPLVIKRDFQLPVEVERGSVHRVRSVATVRAREDLASEILREVEARTLVRIEERGTRNDRRVKVSALGQVLGWISTCTVHGEPLLGKALPVGGRAAESRRSVFWGSSASIALLLEAARSDDLGEVKRLLEGGSGVMSKLPRRPILNGRDALGKTALMYACHYGNRDVVHYLLTKATEAEVNSVDDASKSALHHACRAGAVHAESRPADPSGAGLARVEIVSALLGARAEAEARDKSGRTPLMFAVASGEQMVVQRLFVDEWGYTKGEARVDTHEQTFKVAGDFVVRATSNFGSTMVEWLPPPHRAWHTPIGCALLRASAQPMASTGGPTAAPAASASEKVPPEAHAAWDECARREAPPQAHAADEGARREAQQQAHAADEGAMTRPKPSTTPTPTQAAPVLRHKLMKYADLLNDTRKISKSIKQSLAEDAVFKLIASR
ncbi:unnamed protein product [Prorocentrum cordatum]|uniref:Uncharacterized protein n=1 Tax=Prorocentrum cordatum TaxID=2364126 RepID=A0ABN9SV15_9DINO|nr:unnamed protein product [Polarella glacialis]